MGSQVKKKGPSHKRKKPSRRQDNSTHLAPSTKEGYNRHHLLYPSQLWRGTSAGRLLREHKNCVAEVPQLDLHDIIHEHVEAVPYPGDAICQLAFMDIQNLRLDRQPISKLDLFITKTQMLIMVFAKLGAMETAEALNAQLDALTTHYHGINNLTLYTDEEKGVSYVFGSPFKH